MQYFFKKTFLFFLFTVPLYIILLVLWGEFVPNRFSKNLNYKLGTIGQMQLRLDELKTVQGIDVLFIGSSTAYRGFDTRIFNEYGIECFNLGSSAQTPIQTKYLLERYLQQANPKLLVIDVNPLMFTIDGVESSLDIISNDVFNMRMIGMALNNNHLTIYHTLFFAWYVDFFKRKNYKASEERNGDRYISGGYVEHELTFFKKVVYERQEWNFKKKQFDYFQDLILYLKANSNNFIIVQTPITSNLYFSKTNNKEFDYFMEKQGKYYNFNEIISLDDSLDFTDAFHLNQNGVKIYNEKLIEVIEPNLFK